MATANQNQQKPELVTPIVHMNGTSKKELLELRETFHEKLRDAYQALKQMAPNGRDYYPEPGRMERAVEQHRRRMLALDALIDEMEKEATAIYEQGRR